MTKNKVLSVTVKDCVVQTFRSGGKGGQNQNKRDTGVRIIHQPSGAVGESRGHRTQLDNKRAAFRRMADTQKFRIWINRQLYSHAEIERQVAAEMEKVWNIRTEVKRDGKWVTDGDTTGKGSDRLGDNGAEDCGPQH